MPASQNNLPVFLLGGAPKASPAPQKGSRPATGLLDKGLDRMARVVKTVYTQWDMAERRGLLQRLDARTKLVFLLFFVIVVSAKRTILPEAAVGVLVATLGVLSRLDLRYLGKRLVVPAFLFGFVLSLPAALNVIVPGSVLLPLVTLPREYHVLVYEIPRVIGITVEGLDTVLLLTLRVTNSVALSLLVLCTTPFSEVMRALKLFRVPDVFLMVITLAYKYIFLLASTVEDMYLARKSRLAGATTNQETRNWAAGRMALLFKRSQARWEEVYRAMLARGFNGDVRFLGRGQLSAVDWMAGSCLLLIGVAIAWM